MSQINVKIYRNNITLFMNKDLSAKTPPYHNIPTQNCCHFCCNNDYIKKEIEKKNP